MIAGGGVAALETVLALRDLLGDAVRITLVAPEPEFEYRPMRVAEPFGHQEALRLPLARFAEEFGAVVVADSRERQVVLRGGRRQPYGTLVVAVGAVVVPPFADAITFGGPGSAGAMRGLVDDLKRGTVGRIAFIAPTLTGWTLPLY